MGYNEMNHYAILPVDGRYSNKTYERRRAVLERVIEFVASRLEVDAGLITEKTNIMEDLDADSLDVVELVMAAEEYFGIKVEDEDIMSVKTIGDAVAYLENKL